MRQLKNNRTSVLHLLISSLGGGASHVSDLIVGMPEGVSQIVLLPQEGGHTASFLRNKGCRVEEYSGVFHLFWKIIRLLGKEKCAILHCHGLRAGTYGRIFARFLKVKVVITIHGFHLFYAKASVKKSLLLALERFMQKWTDFVIIVSEEDKRRLAEKNLFQCIPQRVILNGIRLRENELSQQEARQLLQLSEGAFPVLFSASRLHPQKGLFYLIEAMPLVLQHYPATLLIIAGEGPEREGLIDYSKRLQVNSSVWFLGNREDIAKILPSADVYVSASLWEGLPLSILEAMQAGIPVVATNVAGNREVVLDRETGILVAEKTPTALAKGILEMLEDKEKREQYVQNSKLRVRQSFSLDRMIRETNQVYCSF